MSKNRYEQAYSVVAVGSTTTSTGTSQNIAIPNGQNGVRARFVRLMVTGNLYVKLGTTTAVATVNDMLLSPNFDVILDCMAFDHIGVIQETASAKLNMVPLET